MIKQMLINWLKPEIVRQLAEESAKFSALLASGETHVHDFEPWVSSSTFKLSRGTSETGMGSHDKRRCKTCGELQLRTVQTEFKSH